MRNWIIFAILFTALPLGMAATVNYSYDDAGRLILVDYGNGSTIAYTYDKAGNLLTRMVTPPAQGTSTTKKAEKPEKPVQEKEKSSPKR